MMVLPTLLFAGTSIWRRGLRTDDEYSFGLFIIFFLGTLLIRQYLHYWILMLPFLVLLACREFAVGSARESDESPEGSLLKRFAGFAREVGSPPEIRSGEEGQESSADRIVFSAPVTGSPPPASGDLRVPGGLIPYKRGDQGNGNRGEGGAAPGPGKKEE
jgi:hypothetical protein